MKKSTFHAVPRRLTFSGEAMRIFAALLLMLLAGQAPAATLLGQYWLEELQWTGAAAEVRDSSGNNRHGQAIGAPLPSPTSGTPARPGRPGTCTYGSFPGPRAGGGALSIGGLPVNLAASAKTSVSFWMYWDGTDSVMPIGWFRHDLWLVGGHFGFNTGNSDVFGIASAGLANRWVHVVAVFTNGNVAADELYIDGVAQAMSQRQSTPNNATAVVDATLRIGGWRSDTSYRFSGRIDDVKVYDGQLTAAEVAAVFNETHVCAPRLMLEWRLDECALGAVAGEVLDASGNGNNGTPLLGANTAAGRVCRGGIFNGVSPTRIKAASNFVDSLTNDFTISFWVNPATTHQIDAQSGSGTAGTGGQRYALYPAQGTDAWGPGHAGAGVSVGINGVTVYEHAASYMPPLLVWSGAVSGWTHVAVAYQARQPRLYINGVLAATGLTSTYANVHPGLRSSGGTLHNDGGVGGGNWGWFNGGIDEFRIYDGALDAAQVASIAVPVARSCASCATLAHYRLEDSAWMGAPGEVQDASGNGRHGQALGAPFPVPEAVTPARPGNPGTCGYGRFSGGALNLPVSANTAPGAKTTVSFWMYWDGSNSVMPIGWFRHDLWLVNGHFGFNTANSDVYGISSAGLANRWVHVSAVFTNGSVTSNKLYIDGVLQTLTQRQSTPALANAVVNANLRVSGWQSDAGYRFRSRIDEVNAFDGEMTQSQVLALYNATHPCGGAVVPANFNCVATGENVTSGHLYTKLAGTGFRFDVAALKADGSQETGYASDGDKNVTVEIVDGSGSTACASRAPLAPAVSQTLTFAAADQGRKSLAADMTVAAAYRELRCRVTDANQAPAVVGCSGDSFSVRPTDFSVSSTNANADVSGTSAVAVPTVKAGAAFNLTATAVTGYDGTPALDASKTQAHAGAIQTGLLAGGFAAANPATGAAAGDSFVYDEVGYFRLDTLGVVDTGFTSVDAENGDCTADYSNGLVGGRYGCFFGNSAATGYFGRFIPDHFALTAGAVTAACSAGVPAFTYMSQPFQNLSATVQAQNSADGLTRNYDGSFGSATVAWQAENSDNGSDLSARLSVPTSSPLWAAGAYSVNTPAAEFRRATPDDPDGPFDSLQLGILLADPDGVALDGLDMNAATAGACAPCTAKAVGATSRVRFGRLHLQNTHGSELRSLRMPVSAEYWNGTGFVTHAADNCTGLGAVTLNLPPSSCTLPSVVSGLGGTLSSGSAALTLSAPNVRGCVDLRMVTPVWLRGRWDDSRDPDGDPATNYDDFAAARASFGIFRERLIYRREVTR